LVVVFGAHSDQPYRFKPIKLPFLYIVGRLSILEFIQELLVVAMDLSLLILVPTLVGQIKDCATVWLLEKCFRFDMFFQFMTLARIRHQLIKQCTLLSFNDLGHFLYQSSITIFNLILSFFFSQFLFSIMSDNLGDTVVSLLVFATLTKKSGHRRLNTADLLLMPIFVVLQPFLF
jgi:hypothetical protein